ncbi:unnamed protein product [Paramecium pentaurelia]|uniref:RING-type domain-containing protein n=1 Tax=Paramecium pentaurelia TaxID=43138 RepID=A0A8S1X170_9CILI|nr:unnamed protein product [Paramecium pentaurelia]
MKTSQQILSDDIKKLEFIQNQMGEKIMKNSKIESLLQEINNRIQIVFQLLENEYNSDKNFLDWKNTNLIDTNTKMLENLDSDLLYSFNLNGLSLNSNTELQINQFKESNNIKQVNEQVVQTERVQKKTQYNLSFQSDQKKSQIFTKPDFQYIQKKNDNIFYSNKQDNNTLRVLQRNQEQEQNKQYQMIQKKSFQNNLQLQQQQSQPNNQSKPTYQYQVKQELKDNIKENMAKFNMSIVYQTQVLENDKISQCPICLESCFTNNQIQDKYVVQLSCSHQIHYDCLQSMISENFVKCPFCNQIFGQMIGDQPDGDMEVQIIKKSCEGYTCDTIQITYFFMSGQKQGKKYQGTIRIAYLPNNQEGQQVLGLLKQAFQQKLIFTIGTSLSTGQESCIIWNGIHHKTSLEGGSQKHGYPDPQYFYRVIDELKQKGIILKKG